MEIKIQKLSFSCNRQSSLVLDDINIKILSDRITGIIGNNASGKSTLLRAIGGIFSPDNGEIDLHGNSISLLSIGIGFQRNLTGYENIFLSGLLLGYSEEQIKEKIDDIIDFSELKSFIYQPVSSYSSGMYSKLAFSITVTIKPDIMLLDEVLSVGDQAFKKKSRNKMKSLIHDKNRTVVIVSHSISTLSELCDRMIWMEAGKIVKIGDTQEVLDQYCEYMDNK